MDLGIAYKNLGQYPKAIEYFEQALAISRKIRDVRGEGAGLGNLGVAYDNQGQYAKAIEFLEKSRVIFEDRLRINFPFKAELDRLNKKPRD